MWLVSQLFDDTAAIEEALRLNIEAGTGPTTLSSTVDRELEAWLSNPTLAPLVRRLSLYANRPARWARSNVESRPSSTDERDEEE